MGKSFFGKKAMACAVLTAVALGLFGMQPAQAATKYETYENDEVCFSVEYPEEYTLSEPNENNLLISDGDDFRVSIEYMFYTTQNSFVYSAEDFARQIEEQPVLLADWVGAEELELTDSGRKELGSREGYEFVWRVSLENGAYEGHTVLVDGGGDFGCYVYQWMVREDTPDREVYDEQQKQIEDSFRITGAYQPEGYTIYEFDDMRFMVRDTAAADVDMSGGTAYIYPVDDVFTECAITIRDTSIEEADGVEEALDACTSYYFNYRDDAAYICQPTEQAIGRYDYTEIDVEYDEEGERFTNYSLVFPRDEKYFWLVSLDTTDAYGDTALTALMDVLFSLQVEEDGWKRKSLGASGGAADVNAAIEEVLDAIEARPGFMANTDYMEPLAAANDFNGDGVWELIASYESKDGGAYCVCYEVWSLLPDGPVQLASDVLYMEVGGNSGAVGLARDDGGASYLVIEQSEPEGDQFNEYYTYIPWSDRESALEEDWVYMECHGTYGEEENGRYILGDTRVDREEFEDRQEDFYQLYTIDLLQGHGNGDIMPFDVMRQWDF